MIFAGYKINAEKGSKAEKHLGDALSINGEPTLSRWLQVIEFRNFEFHFKPQELIGDKRETVRRYLESKLEFQNYLNKNPEAKEIYSVVRDAIEWMDSGYLRSRGIYNKISRLNMEGLTRAKEQVVECASQLEKYKELGKGKKIAELSGKLEEAKRCLCFHRKLLNQIINKRGEAYNPRYELKKTLDKSGIKIERVRRQVNSNDKRTLYGALPLDIEDLLLGVGSILGYPRPSKEQTLGGELK